MGNLSLMVDSASKEPFLLRLVAPSGERRMVDATDLSQIDIAWIYENFPDAKWAPDGYMRVHVEMGYIQ